LGKLIAINTRKLGLYQFLKRYERFLRRLYHAFHDRLGTYRRIQPVTTATATQVTKNEPQVLINSPLVEAFVAGRAIQGNTDEHLLVHFYDLGQTIRQVLCVEPTDRNIQALYMLAKAGTKVTCLNCQARQVELQTFGFTISSANLNEWLMTQPAAPLGDFDSLLLDAEHLSSDVLRLLGERLEQTTKVLLNGYTAVANTDHLGLGLPVQVTGNLAIYEMPSEMRLNLAPQG
jgi:hypothetical protein